MSFLYGFVLLVFIGAFPGLALVAGLAIIGKVSNQDTDHP